MKLSELAAKICSATACNYVATEAFYHLWGKANGFTPVHIGDHWLLEHLPSGFLIDVMASSEPDFESAEPGTMPATPSKRAQTIIAGIKQYAGVI